MSLKMQFHRATFKSKIGVVRMTRRHFQLDV